MTEPWVCLMYHEVLAGEPGPGVHDYFAVSRQTFARHLDAIRAAGYKGCSLAQAIDGRHGRPVAITFDDGTAGHALYAVPELVSRGMTATFFVTTGWVGHPGYVTWEQLGTMRRAGMEIGSHTRSHRFLSELGAADLETELRGSREDLDSALNQATAAVALPGGDAPKRDLRPLLARAGYTVVATSRWGRNPPGRDRTPLWIRRCTVPAADRDFQRTLAGDPGLRARRRARESALGALRTLLGPSRYTRWRRRFLDAAAQRRNRSAGPARGAVPPLEP
jgi:peptidoglycan/xylan/chitin deacetylase (PgdA/CDA1 family)